MYTDRYPDCYTTNFQTENLDRNAFSVRLKLANNPKNCMSIRSGVWTSTETGKVTAHSMAGSQGVLVLFSSLCLTDFVAHFHVLKGKSD